MVFWVVWRFDTRVKIKVVYRGGDGGDVLVVGEAV